MQDRIALVGAVGREGMLKHIELLTNEGAHWDGWTHKNVAAVATRLMDQLGRRTGRRVDAVHTLTKRPAMVCARWGRGTTTP